MPIQVVMDSTGDSRHFFDANDAREVAKAEQRFRELRNVGFTAAGPDRFKSGGADPIVRPHCGRNSLLPQAGRRLNR
ncbi:hypothetical protein ACVWZ6_006150 [Bradyrhizobium sp. GM6.1]